MHTNTPIENYHALEQQSLGQKLQSIIHNMPKGEITLFEILKIFEQDGLLLLSIFLSLIFLVPVSIPGVSTVFGSAILLIGLARLFERHLWLPKRIGERAISAEKLTEGLQKALVWFARLEKINRPQRLAWLTSPRLLQQIHKLAFIFAALLLMMPFGLVPLSNTLPAAALILFSIGEIEKDGLSVLLAHLTNLATVVYFGFLIAGGGITLFEGLQHLPF